MDVDTITLQQLGAARQEFATNEPRDLFYYVAIELIELSLQGKTKVKVAEALAVLLQTWNMAFYRFHPFTSQHLCDIERVVVAHEGTLAGCRQRSIESFCEEDRVAVNGLFVDFEQVLGPVGAVKSLHLLAPRFFPLWDRAIAKAYGVHLKEKGRNAAGYIQFMARTKKQVEQLGGESGVGCNPLKAIDEYNYCEYTKKHWKRS